MASWQRNVSLTCCALSIPSLQWFSLLLEEPYVLSHWVQGLSLSMSLRCPTCFLALWWVHFFWRMTSTFEAFTSVWLRPFAKCVQIVGREACNAWSLSCSWLWWTSCSISSSEWHSSKLCHMEFSWLDPSSLKHLQSILHAPSTNRFHYLPVTVWRVVVALVVTNLREQIHKVWNPWRRSPLIRRRPAELRFFCHGRTLSNREF